MRIATSHGPFWLSYSTNVHPAETLASLREMLARDVGAVRDRVRPDGIFGVELRLGSAALRELAADGTRADLRRFLDAQRLAVFSLNGFPLRDFHQARVKEEVYRPDWAEAERQQETIQLCEILAVPLPPDTAGTVSTSPGSFKPWGDHRALRAEFARGFAPVIHALARLKREQGCTIRLAVEPEPFCTLETVREFVDFATDELGFRNDPGEPKKEHDLIVLGDSFGVGSDTTQEKIWSALFRDRYGWSVYNLSMACASPWDEWMNLALEIDCIHPRKGAVVLWALFTGNDLDEPYGDLADPPPPVGLAERFNVGLTTFRRRSVIRQLTQRFFRIADPSPKDLVEKARFADGSPALFYKPYDLSGARTVEEVKAHPHFPFLQATFAAMATLARAHDLRVAVVVIPTKHEVYAKAGDVVVTADIPLAARCLKSGALVLSPRGREFTEDSIGDALANRAVLSHLRESGVMTGGPAPFQKKDRSLFLQKLHEIEAFLFLGDMKKK